MMVYLLVGQMVDMMAHCWDDLMVEIMVDYLASQRVEMMVD